MVLIQGLIVSSMAHCDAQQSQQAATEIVRASSHFRGFSIFKLQATDLKILCKHFIFFQPNLFFQGCLFLNFVLIKGDAMNLRLDHLS